MSVVERKMMMPKNVICKKCNNLKNAWCEKVLDSPDPDMSRDCQHFCEKTNADRIRAMSDEELADFIYIATHNYSDRYFVDSCVPCCSLDRTLEWLKQPAAADLIDEDSCTVTLQGWISVKDRLPEKVGTRVLTYSPEDGVNIGKFIGYNAFVVHLWDVFCHQHRTTHWMPLPDPPEGIWL